MLSSLQCTAYGAGRLPAEAHTAQDGHWQGWQAAWLLQVSEWPAEAALHAHAMASNRALTAAYSAKPGLRRTCRAAATASAAKCAPTLWAPSLCSMTAAPSPADWTSPPVRLLPLPCTLTTLTETPRWHPVAPRSLRSSRGGSCTLFLRVLLFLLITSQAAFPVVEPPCPGPWPTRPFKPCMAHAARPHGASHLARPCLAARTGTRRSELVTLAGEPLVRRQPLSLCLESQRRCAAVSGRRDRAKLVTLAGEALSEASRRSTYA